MTRSLKQGREGEGGGEMQQIFTRLSSGDGKCGVRTFTRQCVNDLRMLDANIQVCTNV